jgi:hypothetical protein
MCWRLQPLNHNWHKLEKITQIDTNNKDNHAFTTMGVLAPKSAHTKNLGSVPHQLEPKFAVHMSAKSPSNL